MSSSTVFQAYKHPRTPHWRYEAIHLGTDEHGTWLGIPGGTPAQRGKEPQTTFRLPLVKLIPDGAWWTMEVNGYPGEPEIYVDICTPASWSGTELVEMVDLDLDVIRMRDGTVQLIDEDEFEQHRRDLGYPPSMVTNTRVTAAEMVLAVEARRPPFDDTGRRWLEKLGER